jgi:hypothetical protein
MTSSAFASYHYLTCVGPSHRAIRLIADTAFNELRECDDGFERAHRKDSVPWCRALAIQQWWCGAERDMKRRLTRSLHRQRDRKPDQESPDAPTPYP